MNRRDTQRQLPDVRPEVVTGRGRNRALLRLALAIIVVGAAPLPAAFADSARPLPRWYAQEQVDRGHDLYQAHCAECHRADASGTPEWRTPDADGNYPPPPLNGSAHTWHHPLPVLRRTVKLGNARLGGRMPGFGDQLSDQQIDDVLAWVQSHWSDETYLRWLEISRRSSKTLGPGD